MENKPFLTSYINSITQRIDWLITACGSNILARESARDHLLSGLKEVLEEVYNMGFLAGEKEAGFYYDQKYRVMKYKTKEKTEKEVKVERKEILDIILKEYGLKDEKINKKIRKKVLNENEVEETVQ
jgi:hypothetical protein